MRLARRACVLFSASLFLQSCGSVGQIPYESECRRSPNLEIVSLTMNPDPLPEARKIDRWRAIIRSDGADICPTTLAVVEAESDKPVTSEKLAELSLGTNEVTLTALQDYRLSGREICFAVSAFAHSQPVTLKSPRRFCARTIDSGWWSMR